MVLNPTIMNIAEDNSLKYWLPQTVHLLGLGLFDTVSTIRTIGFRAL